MFLFELQSKLALGHSQFSCDIFKTSLQSKLRRDALEGAIARESYEQFCNRVQQTIKAVPVATIDKIIESMDGRLRQIIDQNGERLNKC